jgi:hypothetical protein
MLQPRDLATPEVREYIDDLIAGKNNEAEE